MVFSDYSYPEVPQVLVVERYLGTQVARITPIKKPLLVQYYTLLTYMITTAST